MPDVLLYRGDCLEEMSKIPDGSVDLVLTDPPYGITRCKWDSVIPFEPMWTQLKRVAKKNAAMVLFGSEPFSSALRMSNIKQYKYDWVWDKVNLYTGALLANQRPLKRHENISVFFDKLPTFNKQYRAGRPYTMTRNGRGAGEYCTQELSRTKTINEGRHNPCSVLAIKGDIKREKGLHPTQKPVALLEYLIRTYTNEGETVLDFTMGSGSTGVACVNTNRNFIGIELDEGYYNIAQKRIEQARTTPLERTVRN